MSIEHSPFVMVYLYLFKSVSISGHTNSADVFLFSSKCFFLTQKIGIA